MKNVIRKIKDILSLDVVGLWSTIWGRKRMPRQENQQAINNWVAWLNTNSPTNQRQWVAVNGLVSVINSSLLVNGGAQYNLNTGFPVKAFLNNATGEVRLFDARRFVI